jgi:ABC-type microcin C transport system duplicated ATPase subunit YejF
LISALEKTDSHTIGLIREEIYDALDKMQAEQYASYIFISCFPSIYKALSEK